VLGRAYIAEICLPNNRQMGVNTFTGDGRTPYTFAHELGHNLGADHDNSKPESIMFPDILTPPQKNFSNSTINVIYDHVAQFGPGCLFQSGEPFPNPGQGPQPTPTPPPGQNPVSPTAISLSLSGSLNKNGKFSATINLDQTRPDCVVSLKGSPKRNKISAGNTLASYSGAQVTQSYSTTVPFKASAKKGAPKAYLQAFATCGGSTTASSEIVTLKPGQVRSKKNKVSIGAWIKKLKKQLS
ncbi:MAG: hypothetical protein KDD62_09685, partial [Bdellovibrionales bacterium]|nr:hypothetical protein [Bdellovibrionales bacterium]